MVSCFLHRVSLLLLLRLDRHPVRSFLFAMGQSILLTLSCDPRQRMTSPTLKTPYGGLELARVRFCALDVSRPGVLTSELLPSLQLLSERVSLSRFISRLRRA